MLGGDGYVSVDEAYDYAYRYVQSSGASQTPQRWLYGGEGAIVLARSPAWAASTLAAAEERKLATVLFADLVGSTGLAGDQDPERVRAVLDRFYDAMAAEVERAGGTVEKFVGDAVMAAFGAPASHEDDAERALHAALGMRRRLGELFGGRLALRIGVNTGDVVAGKAREGSSFVTGDTVNVCARLEQAAAPGEILVGERTVAAARGAFEFAEPATVEAKGKPGGIRCRKLVRALSLVRPRGRRRPAAGVRRPRRRAGGPAAGLWPRRRQRPPVTWSRSSVMPGWARPGSLVSSGGGWAGSSRRSRCCAAAGACRTATGPRTGRSVRC